MSKTILVPDELYERLAALARPFVDKEPADVINWLVAEKTCNSEEARLITAVPSVVGVKDRAPRERGATLDLDGMSVHADSVPDLCTKVMQYLRSKGYWDQVVALAPYKTSSQRYLFSKAPKHPNGKDFFVPIKCHDLYVEAHKNYKTSIEQLARAAAKCGVTLIYRGV